MLCRRWRSLETAGEAFWAALAGVHLAGRLQAEGIRHIHAPWADGPATAAWVASHLSGIPFSFSARARDLHPPDGALSEKLAAASLVRTNTRANAGYLTGLAPLDAAKIVNIYNGVSFAPQPAPERAWQPPFRLLALGRLVPKKGYDILLAACRRLEPGGLRFSPHPGGRRPRAPQTATINCPIRFARERSPYPAFVPHREVPRLLKSADLFLMPSLITPSGDRDGIPNVVLEALSQEVPVVATAVSGLPEVIRPPETGWLAPPADPEALARAVREACADQAEARRRARAGRELVAREFDSVRNYSRLKGLFEGLAGK